MDAASALIQPAISLSQSDRQTQRPVQSSFTHVSPKHRAPTVPTQLLCQLSDQKPMSPSQPAQLFSQLSHSEEPLLRNQNATSRSPNGPRSSEVCLPNDSKIRPSNLATNPLNEHHHPPAPAAPFPKAVPPSPTSPTAPKTTSAIPRLTSSGIPRLVTPRLLAASQVPEQTNSNNSTRLCGSISTTRARPYEQSFRNNPMSLPQTPIPPPYTGQTGPFSPPARSPVEPLDLIDNGHHSDAPYSDRSRLVSRPASGGRLDRAVSERPPRMIGSKINSLKNVSHKPGGGNVAIVDEKLKLGPIKSKCNSLANVKHKPSGGNVQIVDIKLDVSTAKPKVNSMQNVKHVPAGGQVQIVSEKLAFDKTVKSKVGSLKNTRHRPGGGDVQIFKEALPWLKYNKPNLPPEEKARINKQRPTSHGEMSTSSSTGHTSTSNS
ncbi:Microtubule-associated protein [Paragonimus heterotremus]|uniref:Microtubule-associated protein n=1 Tax=Paragonimus heterotremus TaxID=100268 RepID=A0A8J4WJW2_9TREM|nr:Microtubule-associated protein [Paragonimus heterotremus]